ncbi:hypothetical protein ACQPZP_40650 [Spirillospora sp. CA-142024]|uniref:hypothetical protein n=1 Tax=Spirillospora sp. CA-142024 TaxID=3240036 RepID=UPI003D8AB44C
MQQKTNFRSVRKEHNLTLLNVQGHNWDDVEETALQVGTDVFPSDAKLTVHVTGDLKRCADWTGHGHPFGENPKKYFFPELTVHASWDEEEPEPEAKAKAKAKSQVRNLHLRVVRGDNWESIKTAAHREGAEAFPTAEVFSIQIRDEGAVKRCADWTGHGHGYDFGEDPKGFFVENVIVHSWTAVDK